MQKISIVGAGRVGESTAQFLAIKELAREVVLLDLREGAAEGAALDIQESSVLFGFDTRLSGSTNPDVLKDSNLVIITAGLPRKPGMSRSDILDANLPVIDSIVDDVMRLAPEAMLLLVTNPVDVLTYRAWQRSGWDRRRIFGLSGALDAARMAAFVAMETGLSTKDITTMVLGGHGDSMVPLPRYTTIRGIPLDQFLEADTIQQISDRTRQGGAEILALKKTSSAYDAPAAAIVEMVDAITHNRKSVIPSVAILDGEYGMKDIALGVPAVLGQQGMERVIELQLQPDEKKAFENSAHSVREDVAKF
jgi:malate dehydrogenase